jgi:hypothetical protein
VSESTIRRALRAGELGEIRQRARPAPSGPGERSRRAARRAGEVAVQRHTERALARKGQIQEAAPQFVAAEAVRYGGALLAPAGVGPARGRVLGGALNRSSPADWSCNGAPRNAGSRWRNPGWGLPFFDLLIK